MIDFIELENKLNLQNENILKSFNDLNKFKLNNIIENLTKEKRKVNKLELEHFKVKSSERLKYKLINLKLRLLDKLKFKKSLSIKIYNIFLSNYFHDRNKILRSALLIFAEKVELLIKNKD
jgi:hypothetical protein